jgi:hypothetical protein
VSIPARFPRGWRRAGTPLSHRSHCVPGFFFTLVHRVRRRNILRQHKIQLSEHSTHWKVLDYTIRGTHLLVGRLCDLQFLGCMFPRHIARPSRRRRNASFEASWLLNDEWDVGQTRAAESGPKLKPLLECLLILIVQDIFNSDGVVPSPPSRLLRLAFPLCWNIFKPWGGGWIGDELHNVILQYTTYVSTTTSGKSVLRGLGPSY